MAAIQFGGLASGLDTNGIIDGLMKIEQIPLTKLTAKKASVDTAVQTLTGFSTKLSALKSAAEFLADPQKFAAFNASSSDTAIAVSAAGAASPGAYDINVTALAREQRTYSDPVASGTDALGKAGTLTLNVGAAAGVDVTITAEDSLSSIAQKINGSGGRVSASVLYDGSQYRLQVRGLDSGESNAITFGESGLSFGLSTPANTAQTAQDAALTIDGIQVKRPTNQITGVIPGVTMALTKLATGVRVGVASDPTVLQSRVSSFVNAYNDLVNYGHQAAGFGSLKASVDELKGDSSIRSVLNQLGGMFSQTIAGTSGRYTTLGSVGVETTREGTLKLDTTKFQAALTADPAGLAKVFVTDPSTGATGAMSGFKTMVGNFVDSTDSPIATRIAGFGTLSRRIQKDADAMQLRLDKRQQTMRDQFTNLEKRVSAYKTQLSAVTALSTTNSSG